ncbi:MAG: TAXI family TRAP transporter solute-binding subunit [Planctomycetaceae bacterium]|nr:TAXI family TRAP transporter solute-binding subunit [Planctomycetaceae bacterium]
MPRWSRLAMILAVLALPVLASSIYQRWTALPRTIRIATGPEGGAYQEIGKKLAAELRSRCGIEVELIPTSGSRRNLDMLQSGAAELTLFQHGAGDFGPPLKVDRNSVAFVGNLYSEVVHVLGRPGLDLTTVESWTGLRIGIGTDQSGDRTTSMAILHHLNLKLSEVEVEGLGYREVREGFERGTLDAAMITSGVQSPVIHELLERPETPICQLVSIPFAEAFAARHRSAVPYRIPNGLYRTRRPSQPDQDIATVAYRAQLLVAREAPTSLVEEVTRVILSESFQRDATLNELFADGITFMRDNPEFEVHPGALNVFDPELKPLLNSDFVEALEGMRSFVVSLLIAGYLLFRWLRERQRRQQDHQLDRLVRRLLQIEVRQLECDESPDRDDSMMLQGMLDEVTHLRQEALREFTAHQINEDRAVECFLQMCHALSDKINAKLTRQRLDSAIRSLGRSPGNGPSDSARAVELEAAARAQYDRRLNGGGEPTPPDDPSTVSDPSASTP